MARTRRNASHDATTTSDDLAQTAQDLRQAEKLREKLARTRREIRRERFRAVPRRGIVRPDWGYTADELTAIYGDYDQVRTILRALAKRECLCDEDFVRGCHVFLGVHVLEAHARAAKCLSERHGAG